MPEPALLPGDDVVLVPVRADEVDDALAGRLPGCPAGRGWPHQDSAAGLGFTAHGGSSWLVLTGGSVVGELGTKAPPSADGTVEIGYGLAGPARGAGLGTRAVRALLEHLDADPAVRQVVANVAVGNEPSHRLLIRLGFSTDGIVVGGEVHYRRLPGTPLVRAKNPR